MTTSELSLAQVPHPDTLRLDSIDGVTHLQRVDHPVCDPIQHGAPTLGWEGDPRLCMYLDGRANVWVLLRLEWDGEYRVVTVSPIGRNLNEEEVNKLILRLIIHDTRRGFDLKQSVDAHNASLDDAKHAAEADRIENDVADKLHWALKRDGADD